MLDLSAASASQSPYVTMATSESCAASTSQQDDILYEHVTTDVGYEQCHNHYSSLSNTDHLQYDSLQVIMSSTASNQYMVPFNSRGVTGEGDQSSVSIAADGQNRQSITRSQRHAESAPATVEVYLPVLPDNLYATTLVSALFICRCEPCVRVLNYSNSTTASCTSNTMCLSS